MSEIGSNTDIAVVGMGCRFPGAPNPDQFWRNLRDGVEAVQFFTDQELRDAGVDPALIADPDYVKAGVVLENLEMFDAGFFGFSPKDAAIMDPQHRHFLECAWEAIEHAGYSPEGFGGSIGVFAGCGMNAYFMYNLLTNRRLIDSVGLFLLRHTGNDKDFLSTRVSYQFNLRGPSISVQTACSTSLVAIHLACQSLLSGECDMALAGGVTIELPHRHGYLYRDGEILSKDGHCRSFDADSTGTIFGSGAGVVVLRRLRDAIEQGDAIYAVVKGSAINNDGSSKVGYLAPSVDGQASAIKEALAVAGVGARTITYVETHGTATAVGDPIEITALTEAFRESTSDRGYCAIASAKTNIGHLDTAAGVASFIKTVQALHHKQIPPSLHFQKPNPLIDFETSPFFVNTALRDWQANGAPRRAGVSSLGVGGTNAHVVLEEAPEIHRASAPLQPAQLILMSARTGEALDAAKNRFGAYLRGLAPEKFADVAFTSQVGRRAFRHRGFVVAGSPDDAATALEADDPKRLFKQVAGAQPPSIVFVFPGGGAQYPNMGRELYEQQPVFTRSVDECISIVRKHLDYDLKQFMYPGPDQVDTAARELARPLNSILSIFVIEYALAQLWISWGIVPAAMTGHSLGEYAAACLSGVISLEDALFLVVQRGKVFERMPEGAMLNVALPEERLREILKPGLSIAVVNGASSCVASGEAEQIEALERTLAQGDIECARIHINVAAHSPMLDQFLPEFAAHAAQISLRTPSMPYVSNLTGTWIRQEDLDSKYWVRHLRQTVRFADGLRELLNEPDRVFVEVGPGTTLTSLIKQHPDRTGTHFSVASIRHPKDSTPDVQFLLTSLGRLWLCGVAVDWHKVCDGLPRCRVALPTYPFEHKRYWINPGKPIYEGSNEEVDPARADDGPLRKRDRFDDWFYEPVWVETSPPEFSSAEGQNWLIFTDDRGLGRSLARQLRNAGHHVICVREGGTFSASSEDDYTLPPNDPSNVASLITSVLENGRAPHHIVYLWAYRNQNATDNLLQRTASEMNINFHFPVSLLQALATEDQLDNLSFTAVTAGSRQVVDGDTVNAPQRALLLGPATVSAREYPGVRSRLIDLELGVTDADLERLAASVASEALADSADQPVIAYRSGKRWIEQWRTARLASGDSLPLRAGGVYLITGGLGGMALTFAEYLARECKAAVVLVHRSDFPHRDQWDWWTGNRPTTETAAAIQKLRSIENIGGRVILKRADVTDMHQMQSAADQTIAELGQIHGIIHTAGVIDDGPIQSKTRDAAEAVLTPKVTGTLVIDAIARGNARPDFIILCSSTSALLRLAGQVDYVSANAFLDAYAHCRNKSGTQSTRVVAVNWGVWNGVGMAANALRRAASDERNGETTLNAGQELSSRLYGPSVDWTLSEHKLRDGSYVLPGTAYVELAVAAGWQSRPQDAIELSDLFFVSPLVLDDAEERRISVQLAGHHISGAITISSAPTGKSAQGPVNHAHGQWTCISRVAAKTIDVAAIRARCTRKKIAVAAGERFANQYAYLDFGPRWSNVRDIFVGNDELLAELQLGSEYSGDLDSHPLHPALLDMATGCGIALTREPLSSRGLFVPLSYGRVLAHRPLIGRICSHVRLTRESESDRGIAVFDVIIADGAGNVLVEIEQFTMRRVDSSELSSGRTGAANPAESRAPSTNSGNEQLRAWVDAGITQAEGAAVLGRILRSGSAPQVVASSLDLASLMRRTAPKRVDRSHSLANASAKEACSPIEADMLKLWSDLLGADSIGLEDDFFDLGGQSLIAVRLFTKIKRTYKVDLGLATLFEARTVRQLAAVLSKQLGASDTPVCSFSCMVPLRKEGTKPVLFCVHGIGGNVLGYRELVKHLPEDQPFYAIQAQGLNRQATPLTSMKEIAACYVREVLTVQPEGPYYLSGYSFGGVAAYEMAQQLTSMGHCVALLAMFDSDRPDAKLDLTTRIKMNLKHLWRLTPEERGKYVKRKLDIVAARWWRTEPESQEKSLREDAPPAAFQDLRQANFRAYRSYETRPYPGRLTLFQASEFGDSGYRKPNLGWAGLALQGIDVRSIPGNHMTILYEPNVPVLARKLTECLAEIHAAQDQAQESGIEMSSDHATQITMSR